MKRLTLLGLKKDKEKLLKLMQGMGCVELTPLLRSFQTRPAGTKR